MNDALETKKIEADCGTCDGAGYLLQDNYGPSETEAWTEVPCPSCTSYKFGDWVAVVAEDDLEGIVKQVDMEESAYKVGPDDGTNEGIWFSANELRGVK